MALRPVAGKGHILVFFELFHLEKKVLHCHLLARTFSLIQIISGLNGYIAYMIWYN